MRQIIDSDELTRITNTARVAAPVHTVVHRTLFSDQPKWPGRLGGGQVGRKREDSERRAEEGAVLRARPGRLGGGGRSGPQAQICGIRRILLGTRRLSVGRLGLRAEAQLAA